MRIRHAAVALAACTVLLPTAAARAAPDHLRVSADPNLSPSFRSGVGDYVSRCHAGRPLRLSVHAPAGQTVAVDGRAARSGTFTTRVRLGVNQSTVLAVR